MTDDTTKKIPRPTSLSPTSFRAIVAEVSEAASSATSLAPEVKAAKERTSQLLLLLGTFTDWLGVIAIVVFVLAGKMTAEDAMPWLMGAISGVAIGKARGKQGGSTSALVFALAGKVGVGGAIKSSLLGMVMLFTVGCAALAPLAKTALEALAPVAADALKREAERRGVDIDRSEAVCVPLPEEYQPEEEAVIVVCSAPVVE